MALIKVQKRAKPGFVFLLDERDFLKAQDIWVRDEDVQAAPAPPPPPPVLPVAEAPLEEDAPAIVTDEPREAAVDPSFYRRTPRRKTRVLPEE